MTALPPLLHPERVASASLAGYLYQTIGIAILWVELNADEVLVCEGNEDADRHLLGGDGSPTESAEIQFKLHNGNFTVRDSEVRDTVLGFLRAFHAHEVLGRIVRFVFTSNALAGRQQLNGADPPLPTNVLKVWSDLAVSARREEDEGGLVQSLQRLAEATRPQADNISAKARSDFADLEASLAFLDADPSRWKRFLSRVEWRLGDGDIPLRNKELERRLAEDPRTRSLPSKLLARRLVAMVLETSCRREAPLRELRREGLEQLARSTGDELRAWADSNRFLEIWEHIVALNERVRRLETEPWEELKRSSSRTTADLSRFSVLELGGRRVHLERELMQLLLQESTKGHLLVTGDPGSGKSGFLHSLGVALESAGITFLAFDADDPTMVNGTLLDRLENNADVPVVVMIDALDSVRGYDHQRLLKVLRQLVERSRGWNVVATVRTFDLVHGTGIQRLFQGTPPSAHADPRLKRVRHLRVDDLSDTELSQLEGRLPELAAVVREAPPALRTLLRNPFHLSLAAQLITRENDRERMRGVRTRMELMGLYWDERIAQSADFKEVREAVLRCVCARMIADGRLLCDKSALADAKTRAHLLSLNVLREPPFEFGEPNDRAVMFAHHILFDYAVARVWIPADAVQVTKLLVDTPRLVVLIRPSLEMFFASLWLRDDSRTPFWDSTIQMANSGMREIGKIIGPLVAAREARSLADLDPLLAALRQEEPGAEVSLAHLVAALQGELVAGAHAGPWSALAENISAMGRRQTALHASRLLQLLTADVSKLTTDQLRACGRAARTVLRLALAEKDSDWLIEPAIAFVCKTAASDLADVAAVVSVVIEPERLREIGYRTARVLGREIDHLVGAPALVSAIYASVFNDPDKSPDPTPLGRGVVLSLSSNRRQDYEGALYLLAKAYPKFLQACPVHATDALFRVTESYERRSRRETETPTVLEFSLNGQPLTILLDGSNIAEHHSHDQELELLRSWEGQVAEWGADAEHADLVKELFEFTAKGSRTSAVWRRWLRLGARAPQQIGVLVAAILENGALYRCPDLEYDAVECLHSAFPVLCQAQRLRIESALLDGAAGMEEQHALHQLAPSLGGLDPAQLVSAESKELQGRIVAAGISTTNQPSFSFSRSVPAVKEDPDDWLRRKGVPVDDEPNRSVLRFARALGTQRSVARPDDAGSAKQLLAAMLRLERHLDEHSSHLSPQVAAEGWEELVSCVAPLCASVDDTARAQLAALALKAAQSPCPLGRIDDEASFAKSAGWCAPHVRGVAAEALGALARISATRAILDALGDLADDCVPSVRFRTYQSLTGVCSKAPNVMQEIVEVAVANDLNPSTLSALVEGPLGDLADANPTWASRLIGYLLNRRPTDTLRRPLVDRLVDLWITAEDRAAGQLLAAMALCPWSEETSEVTSFLRSLIEVKPKASRTSRDERARRLATELMFQLARGAAEQIRTARERPVNEVKGQDLERLRGCARLVDECAQEVYFASGAYEDKKGEASDTSPERMSLFMSSMAPTMEHLADAGIGPAAHNLLQTLEYLMPVEPKRVVQLVARTVLAGRAGDYQFDGLATKLVVQVVAKIFAEHRSLLAEDEDTLKAVVDVLDVFVRVGWPEAYELTYGLQELFR